ncbi:MAG: serine hydrolase domain-containing protein, partial [Pseudomonadota bacterium]
PALAEGLRADTGAPGVVVGYVSATERELAVTGVRRRGDPAPVTEADLWHLGSITKSMTALLVARLVAAGEVSWDDSIGTVLGAQIPDLHPGYAPVTYMDLLQHRAGLVANVPLAVTRSLVGLERDVMADRLTYARAVLTEAPLDAPFTYSNAGYVVVGAMLEARTGQSWEALMRAHVFAPLGLTSAGFGAPGEAETLSQPRGHVRRWGRLRPVEPGPAADNIAALGPAGTVHMSAADLLAYLGVHLARAPEVLPAEAWDRLHVPPPGSDYAAGWAQMPSGGLVHTGSNTMWYVLTVVRFDPPQVLVIGANSGDIKTLDPAAAEAARGLLEALEGP